MALDQAAVLLYPGCTISEVIELATRMANAGFDVAFASPDGKEVVDQSGLRMHADCSIAAISRDVRALVIPGGDILSIHGDETVHDVVRDCYQRGAIVAGICAGVLVAADAGVTNGRHITHNYRQPWAPPEIADFAAPLLASAHTEVDRTVGVVVDENLVTALPNATAEFAMTVCRVAAIYDPSRAAMLTQHLRGDFVPELFE